MALPHQLYILYLLSQRIPAVDRELDSYDLPIPQGEEMDRLKEQLEPFPATWARSLLRTNLSLRRWLCQHDLLEMWERPAWVGDCLRLLADAKTRQLLEVGFLRGRSAKEMLRATSETFGVSVRLEVVRLFKRALFCVEKTSAKDWSYYMWRRPNRVLCEEVDRLRDAEAREAMGLNLEGEGEDLLSLQEIIRLTTRKMRDLGQASATAANALAMANLARVGSDAIARKVELREKLMTGGSDEDVGSYWHKQFQLLTSEGEEVMIPLSELEQEPRTVGVRDE